jgi:hypothetical protein
MSQKREFRFGHADEPTHALRFLGQLRQFGQDLEHRSRRRFQSTDTISFLFALPRSRKALLVDVLLSQAHGSIFVLMRV